MRIIGIVFFLCFCGMVSHAQKNPIKYEEFETATAAFIRKPTQFPARTTTVEDSLVGGKLIVTKTIVFEGTPAETSRLLITERGKPDIERIELDGFEYSRSGDGEWEKSPWSFHHPLTESLLITMGSEKYWKESIDIESKKITIYGTSVVTGKAGKNLRIEEYYFSADKSLIKTVTTDMTAETGMILRRVSRTNVSIPQPKIEVPIK